jgi:thiosulfate reductase cytochrome b subunit
MAIAEGTLPADMPPRAAPAARATAAGLSLVGAVTGGAFTLFLFTAPDLLAPLGIVRPADAVIVSLFAAAAVFMALGGVVALARLGLGGAIGLIGVLFWLAACIAFKSFGWLLAVPLGFALLGALTGMIGNDRVASQADRRLIYRQDVMTRLTHWVWAVAMFFLLLSGLQIFNARPNLYIGQESGFAYQNSILDIYALNREGGPIGQTKLFGMTFDTTGVLGVSDNNGRASFTAFPGWATIPSFRDLATGRVVHFFFAWVLVGARWRCGSSPALSTGTCGATSSSSRATCATCRATSSITSASVSITAAPTVRCRSSSYFAVFVVLFPLIILTGLTMSPGMDAAWPWLLDIFGGRQTARTLHFVAMMGLCCSSSRMSRWSSSPDRSTNCAR